MLTYAHNLPRTVQFSLVLGRSHEVHVSRIYSNVDFMEFCEQMKPCLWYSLFFSVMVFLKRSFLYVRWRKTTACFITIFNTYFGFFIASIVQENPSIITMAGGMPNPQTFPIQEVSLKLKYAAHRFIATQHKRHYCISVFYPMYWLSSVQNTITCICICHYKFSLKEWETHWYGWKGHKNCPAIFRNKRVTGVINVSWGLNCLASAQTWKWNRYNISWIWCVGCDLKKIQ